jgi:glycosyltransferase involved in cell wall biosynthesis
MPQLDQDSKSLDITFITPTIGRATLARTVESFLARDAAGFSFEVIVVNDSGAPLPCADWAEPPFVRVIETNRAERSMARNAGLAAARGKYVMFVDDDDYLLPGGAAALLARARETNCPRVYGAYRVVDEMGELINEVHPHVRGDAMALFLAGETIPLGCTLFERSMVLRAGAFSSLYATLEDYDFLIRFARLAPLEFVDRLVLCQRVGLAGSSTDWSVTRTNVRRMREAQLGQPDIFRRIVKSATADPFVRGRVTRVYGSSCAWNAQYGRPLIALSRLAAAVRLCGLAWLSRAYWQGLRGEDMPEPARATKPHAHH